MKKITVDIVGGLGNQLFCYSAGYYLAKKNNFELELRLISTRNSVHRDSGQLTNLSLPGKFRSLFFLEKFKLGFLPRKIKRVLRLLRKLFQGENHKILSSKSLGFDPTLETLIESAHLQGYYQTWKYAQFSRSLILEALERSVRPNVRTSVLFEILKREKVLVLHIRLGDYANEENRYFGILSPEYYRNIFSRHDVKDYKVFVFTDDVSRAKSEYFSSMPSDVIWVDEVDLLTPIETLYLMAQGSAFAIANSTFSWWAAYLSMERGLVIAPSKWFKMREDPVDLIPGNWIREEAIWID